MVVRGQVATMRSSFVGLGAGLAFAIVLVYLLIVINFQSWSEAFIIITALPAALAGICWMLFLTHTTLSVPALMGTIMSMEVATANSVLIISFANERFTETKNALVAALEAGVKGGQVDARAASRVDDVSPPRQPGQRCRVEDMVRLARRCDHDCVELLLSEHLTGAGVRVSFSLGRCRFSHARAQVGDRHEVIEVG